ncbi:MAG: hypothetical protein FVQ82_04655 [Planctomycetes bacterium]|nr:hypothetical protein [Planctomycetota bacterium]
MKNFWKKKKKPAKPDVADVKESEVTAEAKEKPEKHKEEVKVFKILVYGIDKKNLQLPNNIQKRNFKLTFDSYATKKRFDEFDAVISFQGIFESLSWESTGYLGDQYLDCKYDKDELDKRNNELHILIREGGFVCFILCERFEDSSQSYHHRVSYTSTDLCKIALNYDSFYRKNFSERYTSLNIKQAEFGNFLTRYGAACSYFENYNEGLSIKTIAELGSRLTGFVLGDSLFFIPTLIPEQNCLEEYFTILAEALVSVRKKMLFEIPAWVDSFEFSDETVVKEENEALLDRINNNKNRIQLFREFKKILIFNSDALVGAVATILERGFGFSIDDSDELKEDLKILDEQGKPIIFVEVKGTNKGVKREHINQCDSHRERADLSPDFPSILIINTHMRKSRTIEEKDQDVAKEQIKHAVKTNVLILRTLDVLKLLSLKLNNNIPSNEIINLLSDNHGWLKVSDEKWEILEE